MLPLSNRDLIDRWREDTLSEHIRQACKKLGLLAYHTHNSRHSAPGWPDWVISGPGGILFRELKRVGKHPTPSQQAWLDALASHGLNAGVWTPKDWPDVIVPTLQHLTKPPQRGHHA